MVSNLRLKFISNLYRRNKSNIKKYKWIKYLKMELVKSGKLPKNKPAKSGKLPKNKPAKSGKLPKNKPAKSGKELLTIYKKYDNIFSKGEEILCKDYLKKNCLIGKNQE